MMPPSMVNILSVVGARPNIMKVAPITAAVARRPGEITQTLVHTGQHYDEQMSAAFFRDLAMPAPEINLEVGSGTHAEQTARVMLAFEPVLIARQPDWVVVVGDVNSTLACALVASKLCVPVAHVEAGLRSFDRTMPEELNRVLTDQLADLLLTPSADGDANLLREGVPPGKIVRVGNVMIDTLFWQLDHARDSTILDGLALRPREFAVVTLHRPANVDDDERLARIVEALAGLASRVPVIFPLHPRTRERLRPMGDAHRLLAAGVVCGPPLGYLDFVSLQCGAGAVVTDSGTVQEETSALGVRCYTLRSSTERPVTVTHGTNQLLGDDPRDVAAVRADAKPTVPCAIPLWDGKAGRRIAEAIVANYALVRAAGA
jgi:UDP-N-acetylglucosamine 2-epimerase (non-hydrolysing)